MKNKNEETFTVYTMDWTREPRSSHVVPVAQTTGVSNLTNTRYITNIFITLYDNVNADVFVYNHSIYMLDVKKDVKREWGLVIKKRRK